MASVYKRGNTWWVRFQWKGQEIRRTARTTSKGEAREYLTAVQEQYRQLDLYGHTRTSFQDAAVQYIQEHLSQKRQSTIGAYQQCLRVLNEAFGDRFMDEITRKEIAKFEAEQLRRVSASTVKHYRAALSGIFKVAMRHEQVDRNPCRDLDPIKVNNARYRFLTKTEWEKLRGALKEPDRSIAEISVLRGMRLGEILDLKWSDIDFDRDEIHMGLTKNGKPRVIPLEGARETIERQQGRRGYIFKNGRGRQLDVAQVSRSVNKAARGAGIENFTCHDLRHTYASWYVQRGGDLYRLQLILGHQSPAMTQRYAHLRVDDLREVAQNRAHGTRDYLN